MGIGRGKENKLISLIRSIGGNGKIIKSVGLEN
jgi:hypothetical protein